MIKFKLWNIAFLCIVLIYLSCDPVRTLTIKNMGNSDLKVKFENDPKYTSLDVGNTEKSNRDSTVYVVSKNESIKMIGGIGSWTDNTIKKQVELFNSIEFENKDLKKVYNTKESIENLFKENLRRGFIYKYLNIEIVIK